jgi:predicted peptidase
MVVMIVVCVVVLLGAILFSLKGYIRAITTTVSAATRSALQPADSHTPVNTAARYGFIARNFTNAQGQALTYYLYIPDHYNSAQKYPLVVLLHGGGERSDPKDTALQNQEKIFRNSFVQVWGKNYSAPYNPNIQQHWPCFVLIPHMTNTQEWVNTDMQKGSYSQTAQPSLPLLLTKELLDSLQHEYAGIDAQRLLITGYSSGGFGVWDAIEHWPNYFAAAAPIAGAGDPSKAAELIHMPIWAFHGAKDVDIPPSGSRDMIQAIKAAGGEPRYTEFPNLGHGAVVWSTVYSTTRDATFVHGFFNWFFAQRR